jgi:hypothetical protein
MCHYQPKETTTTLQVICYLSYRLDCSFTIYKYRNTV